MSDRILRLQHVEVRVPDLELCTAYYTEVVGLIEVAREEGRVLLKCWDEHEHHSVVLRQAPTYGLDHMAFKVAEQADLDYYTDRVEKAGIAVKRFARAELGPGWGEAIRFEAPSGHLVELVYGMEKVGNMLPLTNPPPRPPGAAPRGATGFLSAPGPARERGFSRGVGGSPGIWSRSPGRGGRGAGPFSTPPARSTSASSRCTRDRRERRRVCSGLPP